MLVMKTAVGAGLLLALAGAAWAQAPVVHPGGAITFSYAGPNVTQVSVTVDTLPAPLALTLGQNGVWSVTIPPLKPEIYSYHYTVDDINMADPASMWTAPNLLYHASLVLIPGSAAGLPPQPWEQTKVPHGAVAHYYYHSAVVGEERDYFVYTPPGYDPLAKRKYPVLYLLHGFSDDTRAWTEVGRANFILDNLIAAGKAVPMIVVMPLGYGALEVLTAKRPLAPELVARNYASFTQSLLTEVMPRIERDYRVAAGPRQTAIAGVSMGGAEGLYAGVAHPEKFGYVGAFSAAALDFTQPALQWQAPRQLLWLSCGEQDELVGDNNRALDGWLSEHKVPATVKWTRGRHIWALWREDLVELAPLLFR